MTLKHSPTLSTNIIGRDDGLNNFSNFQVKMVIFVCEKFSPFLHRMQSESPMIAELYTDSARLLHSVLSCFKNSKFLPDMRDGDKLIKVSTKQNCLNMPHMSPSAEACLKKLTERKQKSLIQAVLDMYASIALYLQTKLEPLHSKFAKNVMMLSPKIRKEMKDTGRSSIVKAANELGRFSTAEVDALALQWNTMIAGDFKMLDKERLDKYYCRVIESLKKSEEQSFDELSLFIKLVLSMPHSNASVSENDR